MEAKDIQAKSPPAPKGSKAPDKRGAVASRSRLTAEEMKARGLDPAPYGKVAEKK